jgi:3',5'-cyclic AMP phosphodiesterase CpdA
VTLLLQVSDPHFGTERPPVLAALRALVREQRPDVLVLSGDITQRATRAQFDAAARFVAELQVPTVLAIPGNHDISLFNLAARLFWPYANFRRAFGDDLQPRLQSDALWVVTLNTTRWFRHVDGQVDADQVERSARQFERAPATAWRIVVVHQPVAVPRAGEMHNLLHGNRRALARWAEAGVDVVMGGHIHLPYVLALHDSDQPLARPMWAVQAGTAVSRRVRAGAPNSVNLLRIAAHSGSRQPLQIERWDHRDAVGAFELAAMHTLPAGR